MKRFLLIAFVSSSVDAATLSVTTTNDVIADDGLLSLREAVLWANTNAGVDTITLPEGTYVLSIPGADDESLQGDLDFRDSAIIEGAGARTTIIDANGIDRVMFFDQNIEMRISDIAIVGGLSTIGSGLYNQSTTFMSRCQVIGNGAYAYGGGIEQYSGALFIDQSAIYFNECGDSGGGGIDVIGGILSISNSTIALNASRAGGGIFRSGGEVHLFSSTVVSNSAVLAGGGIWGGVSSMANTLVATNNAPSSPDIQGLVGSLGFNLVGFSGGSAGYVGTDLLDVLPVIGSLRFRGGTTPTHALFAGSPAINRGDPAYPTNAVPYDQRGVDFPRQRGLRVDIGAYEFLRPDEDADGIEDDWEMFYGLNPTNASDAVEHGDRDGFNNLEEYIADTNPNDGLSYFRILQIDPGPTITFNSSTSRLYRLQLDPDLSTALWTNATPWVTGLVATTTYIDTNTLPSQFYRANVRIP